MDDRRFAEHLAWWAEPDSEVEVIPGRVPDLPDVRLPAIPGEILGSIVRRALGKLVALEAHYRVAADPVKVLDQLEATLRGDGFEGIRPRGPGGGFQALPPQWDWTRHFVRGTTGPYFSAFVRPMEENATALWLKWEAEGGWHPSEMRYEPPPMEGFTRMPTLRLPEGVLVAGTGGGGSGGGWSSDALVITDMPPAELHEDAARQLEIAGWKRHRSGAGELAWSTWELPMTGWTGVLAVFALAVADERAMLLRIWSRHELESASKRMSGWRPRINLWRA